MIPDKIYLVPFGQPIREPMPSESSDADTIWSKVPFADTENIAYIRKGALLEWAKEKIAQLKDINCTKVSICKGNPYFMGASMALKGLVEKINSL